MPPELPQDSAEHVHRAGQLLDRGHIRVKTKAGIDAVQFEVGTISQINIVYPPHGLRGERFCPYCHQQLRRDGQFYICDTPGCSFRCYVNRPASVVQ